MANDVITYVEEILKNEQYLAALDKAYKREDALKTLRNMGGQVAVKAWQDTEKAAAKAALAEERAAKGPSAWTQALTANTEAVQNSAKELADFRGKINLGAESLGKIGAALNAVSPELGGFVASAQQGIGAVSGLSGAMGTLGAALPPVAIAGGLVAAGFYDLDQQTKELAEESDRLTKQLDRLKDGLEGIRDVEDELLRRELTLADPNAAKHLEATTEAAEKYAPQVAVVKEELARAREEQRKANAELERWTTGLDAQVMAQDVVTRHQRDAQAALDDATASVAAQEAQLQGLNEAQGSLAGRLITVTTREEEAKEAKERSRDAEKNATEAARERERIEAMLLKTLLEGANAEIKRAATLEEAKASLADLKRASEEALATEEERIQLAAQAAREAAVAVANEAQAASDSAAERKRIAQDLAATLININVDEARQFKAIEDEKTKAAKEAAEERAKAAVDTAITTISAAADASAEIAEAIGKQNAEAGEKAWRISQQIALIQATAAALEAGAKAAAGAAALGPIAAGVAGAATFALVEGAYVAKLAALETPTFSDTPAGGYRFDGANNTIQGAPNDTAILFRDPLEGFQQALDVLGRRQAPTSTPSRGGRDLIGKQTVMTPVSRLLTRDVERVTRGRI